MSTGPHTRCPGGIFLRTGAVHSVACKGGQSLICFTIRTLPPLRYAAKFSEISLSEMSSSGSTVSARTTATM